MDIKLAISNIAWGPEDDGQVYRLMHRYGFTGLEIAPTRIFPERPYDKLCEADIWADTLRSRMGLIVCSMQSIWYGRQENIFGSGEERRLLLDYTKKAIGFAAAISCHNLVLGCPRNRVLQSPADPQAAIPFFKRLGAYAATKDTVVSIEANPKIYGTNYINDTLSAIELVRTVDSPGFLLNLDTGTMIQNGESLDGLVGNIRYVNHVHLSEPRLKPISKRRSHQDLLGLLKAEGYEGFLSIEMGRTDDLASIEKIMDHVAEIVKG